MVDGSSCFHSPVGLQCEASIQAPVRTRNFETWEQKTTTDGHQAVKQAARELIKSMRGQDDETVASQDDMAGGSTCLIDVLGGACYRRNIALVCL